MSMSLYCQISTLRVSLLQPCLPPHLRGRQLGMVCCSTPNCRQRTATGQETMEAHSSSWQVQLWLLAGSNKVMTSILSHSSACTCVDFTSLHVNHLKLLVCLLIPFQLSGLVIVCHVTNTPFEEAQKLEMIRYLRNVQREDGGWGL